MSSSEISGGKSSFNNSSKQYKGNKRIKPLTRDFFTQLIKLETDFQNKSYTVTTLDELIQFYAKAVEYYDSIKDEISSYFMFKIQDILATKKSLKMLLEQNTKVGAKRGLVVAPEEDESNASKPEKKKVTFNEMDLRDSTVHQRGEESSEDEEEKQLTQFEKNRQAKKAMSRKERISISTMKSQKQRFVNFFYKMETQKASEKLNMNTVVNEFTSSSDKNDEYIKGDIDTQRERLRRRIDQKKLEGFMSHTMNVQSFHISSGNNNDAIYENFLNELEEGEQGYNPEGTGFNESLSDNVPYNDQDQGNEDTEENQKSNGSKDESDLIPHVNMRRTNLPRNLE